jgi:prepilin-type N-terminal cleavage/methylation domain-containing protein
MRRHAFTLIEVVIALALVAGVLALVAPVLVHRLAEQSFDAAMERLRSHLLLGRAEAMSRGQPIAVLYRPGSSTLEFVLFEPATRVLDDSRARRESLAREPDPWISEQDDDRSERPEWFEPWMRLDFRGLTVAEDVRSLTGDVADAEWISPDRSTERPEFNSVVEDDHAVRVAVFLRDGSSLLARHVFLSDGDGRVARVAVNPWTGAPTVEPLPPSMLVAPSESEADALGSVDPDHESTSEDEES